MQISDEYKESLIYKTGAMYAEVGNALMNPKTRIDELSILARKYKAKIDLSFVSDTNTTQIKD